MSDRVVAYVRLQSKATGAPLVHPDLRKLLVRLAIEDGMSLNETAVSILSEAFGMEFTATATGPTGAELTGEELNLRIPLDLYTRISDRTARPQTVQDAIRAALSDYFSLPLPDRQRGATAATQTQ